MEAGVEVEGIDLSVGATLEILRDLDEVSARGNDFERELVMADAVVVRRRVVEAGVSLFEEIVAIFVAVSDSKVKGGPFVSSSETIDFCTRKNRK